MFCEFLNYKILISLVLWNFYFIYYRESRGVILNHSQQPFTIISGMRIAQIVIAPIYRAEFLPGETLATTARGKGGFGHTGTY